MYYWLIPLIIGFIILIPFLFFRVKEKRKIAVIFKGAVSLMFITTALVAWLTSKNPENLFGVFVLTALFFGLLGDIFLDIKYIYLKHEFLFMVLGFFAFAIGHIFFTTGLFVYFFNFKANILYIIIPILVAALLVVATLVMEKITPIRYNKMKPFVIIYGIFLFSATAFYLSASIQSNFKNPVIYIMFGGLVFFMLSDLILNNTYFAPGYNKPVHIIVNHVLYYIGQFAIAMSLFFLI